MTTPPHGPRRSPGFNALIVGIVTLLLVVAGVYVWNHWTVNARSSLDDSRDAVVQPAETPPAGNAAVKARPADRNAPGDPSGDAVARGAEAAR